MTGKRAVYILGAQVKDQGHKDTKYKMPIQQF